MVIQPMKTNDDKTFLSSETGVQSECGKLDVVIMHRPGRDLGRLREDNLQYLLYDALPDVNEAHRSHDIFSQYLRDQGSRVVYLVDLLRETLCASDVAREHLIDGIVAHSHFSDANQYEASAILRQWLLTRTPEQLTEDTTAGVTCTEEELGTSALAQQLMQANNPINEFIVPPLPNLIFMRDGFSIMEKNVFIWQMAKPARRNEPLLLRIIFQYHPQLSTSGLNIIEWKATNDSDEYPTVEGGDVAYIGQGVAMIGCSERTNRAGIEALARTGLFRKLIAIVIPPKRHYMHLDTVLSSVGKHAFTLHGPLAEIMEVFTVEHADLNNNIYAKPNWVSHGCDIRQALRKLLNDPELIFYDALDEETSVLEQRECRHNVVAVDNDHVVVYAGSDPERGIVTQLTHNQSCRVGEIPPQGLAEGGGGVHCMTNAIRRRAN